MSKSAKHTAPKTKKTAAPRSVAKKDEWVREAGDTDELAPVRRGPKKGVFIAIVVAAVLIILLEAAYLLFGHFYSKMNFERAQSTAAESTPVALDFFEEEEDPLPEGAVNATEDEISAMEARIQEQLARSGGSKMSDADVINILLIGTDARTRTEAARSDVMMLASLNKKTHKVVLTSFMRDIYTYIPTHGYYNRLNTPFALGSSVGERAGNLITTLENDFGVEINNYAAVNFYDFANIVDAVGGVDLYLTSSEVDFINGQAYWGEQAQLGVGTGAAWLEYTGDGVYHLNGTQALAHCRNRSSAGSDYDRTERQRTTIATLLEKAKTLSIDELYSLLDTVLPMVTTDLTQADCLSLILSSAEYLGYEVETLRIPAADYSDAYISGMAVLSIDFNSNARILQDTIYGANP